MCGILEEENTYFKNVIKEAVEDIKNHKRGYVFDEEQIAAVREIFGGKLKVEEKEGIYYLTTED